MTAAEGRRLVLVSYAYYEAARKLRSEMERLEKVARSGSCPGRRRLASEILEAFSAERERVAKEIASAVAKADAGEVEKLMIKTIYAAGGGGLPENMFVGVERDDFVKAAFQMREILSICERKK